jgi:hypothetical protein
MRYTRTLFAAKSAGQGVGEGDIMLPQRGGRGSRALAGKWQIEANHSGYRVRSSAGYERK